MEDPNSRVADDPTNKIKEVFAAMDRLSQRPFEYFVSGISFMLVLIGLFGQPWKNLTQEELWVIALFGGIGLISGLVIAIKKADYTMRTNIEKIEYKKYMAAEKTKRLQHVQQDGKEADLSDLADF